MREALESYDDGLPEMDPIISYEVTDYGWRGLTSHGEVYEVKSTNGHKAEVPSSIVVAFRGQPVGRRRVTNELRVSIDDYLLHYNRVVELYKGNRIEDALMEAELTLLAAPTLRAKFNRSMVLLAAGRWREGLSEYWDCEQSKPFMRPQVERALKLGLRPWRGEPLTGKRLLVLHAHGFGDTIMMLRYVRGMSKAVMVMPPELTRLARQCGPVVEEPIDCDFFCPILHLLYVLGVNPLEVPSAPYLTAELGSINDWHVRLGQRKKYRIGVAWSIGKPSDGDYPRQIALERLAERFPDAELHSVQTQGEQEAEWCGVAHHKLTDFADCAGLMRAMDEIITVDTAALHLAGAIGHPKVVGLLSYWSSWRWCARWYDNVRLVRQTSSEDWAGALDQL
jgi:hypothetical protein